MKFNEIYGKALLKSHYLPLYCVMLIIRRVHASLYDGLSIRLYVGPWPVGLAVFFPKNLSAKGIESLVK